jgi:cytochrome c oxidase subunit IV
LWDLNKFQFIFTTTGLLKNNHEVKLPEASRLWQISGLILFILSVAYTLIDRIITQGHLVLFFVIFIAIIVTVITTLFMEFKYKKANTRN